MKMSMITKWQSDYFINHVVHKRKYICLPAQVNKAEQLTRQWNMATYQILVKDKVRMDAYNRAIQNSVKGKIVLEIGTGALAPLARICANAGAKKIYAIEANFDAAHSAKTYIQKEGIEDVITVIPGFSYNIELPERADVLVHETIGNMGSDEGMVRAINDAKQRLLKDNAIYIPESVSVKVVPVFHNIKPNPLIVRQLNRFFWRFHEDDKCYHIWNFPKDNFLCNANEYNNWVFSTDFSLKEKRNLEFQITKQCSFNGFVFWNEIVVDPDNVIFCFDGTHWGTTFIQFFQNAIRLLPGDIIHLESYQDVEKNPIYNFKASIHRDKNEIVNSSIVF